MNNIELGGGGWPDKLPWQILEKCASVPGLLSGIVGSQERFENIVIGDTSDGKLKQTDNLKVKEK